MIKNNHHFDLTKIRDSFPILKQKINGKQLVYFDNAATSQKPIGVINTITDFYTNKNANVHRGIHFLSQQATQLFEDARNTVKNFINAKHNYEIIFTRGCTESINLVAYSWGRTFLNKGDEIIISAMEHHANIVPWQIVCNEKGIKIKVINVLDDGSLDFDHFLKLLTNKTRLVAITHVSNTLGTINSINKIIETAHKANAKVLIDGAQAMAHLKIDVQKLNCDFYTFSAHKIYGPMGVGGLYAKEDILNIMPPYQGGGEMIKSVTFEKTIYNELPYKFEAGTPNVAGALAFAEALKFVETIGIENIEMHEQKLLSYATNKLLALKNVKIIGYANNKIGIISFVMDKIHHLDIGTIIDKYGIAVRTGNHCTEPLMKRFNINGTIRVSFATFNTLDEIDIFINALIEANKMLL